MKRDYIILLICLIIFISAISIEKIFSKKETVSEELPTIEVPVVEINKDDTGTTTVKTSKKVVKTTKKITKKVSNQKVETANKQDYINYAKEYGNLNDTQLNCLIWLWDHESGWNPNAVNKSSGACGIPQALPCNKIKNSQGSNDWKAQIRWGIDYINYRYKKPCSAWNHFKNKKWY